MPRAIWSGSISFGLVNVPVRLFSAVSRKSVSFNQLDSTTGSRIRYKKVSALDGEEVPQERIVKGYELASGDYVTVSDKELAALAPDKVRTIDIDEFVDLADIDPIYYDSSYHLMPDEAAVKPYKLLVEAMENSQKVAIGHFVMRGKQHLAALRPAGGRLVMSTMLYADEIVDATTLDSIDKLGEVDVDPREQAMAEQLIATLDSDFDPGRHRDTYREAMLDLIERKASGDSEELVAAPAATSDKVIDLIEALEASVAAAKKSRARHPTAKPAAKKKAGARRPASKAAVKKARARRPAAKSA